MNLCPKALRKKLEDTWPKIRDAVSPFNIFAASAMPHCLQIEIDDEKINRIFFWILARLDEKDAQSLIDSLDKAVLETFSENMGQFTGWDRRIKRGQAVDPAGPVIQLLEFKYYVAYPA